MKLINLTAHLITLNAPQTVTSDYVKPGQAFDLMPAGEPVEVPDDLFAGEVGARVKNYVNNLVAAGAVRIVIGDQPTSVDDVLSTTDYSDMEPDEMRDVLDAMGVEHKPQHGSAKLIQLISENS